MSLSLRRIVLSFICSDLHTILPEIYKSFRATEAMHTTLKSTANHLGKEDLPNGACACTVGMVLIAYEQNALTKGSFQLIQDGARNESKKTEPSEPLSGTATRTGTIGTFFQEPKLEVELQFLLSRCKGRTVKSLLPNLALFFSDKPGFSSKHHLCVSRNCGWRMSRGRLTGFFQAHFPLHWFFSNYNFCSTGDAPR